jgi:hypothetical protein
MTVVMWMTAVSVVVPVSNAFTTGGKDTVLSDEIAERVGIHEPQEVPYIPGRRRWAVSYRGEDCQSLRRQMKKLVRIRHIEIYCNTTRDGALDEAAEETSGTS